MDLDYISGKDKNNHSFKHNQKINKKTSKCFTKNEDIPICAICEIKGHSTKECRYNLKTIRSNQNNNKYQKKYHNMNGRPKKNKGKFEKEQELNFIETRNSNKYKNKYDLNIDYEDLRPLTARSINLIEEPRKNDNKKINTIETNEKSINLVSNNNVKDTWYYDTGAYNHITNNKSILRNFKRKVISLRCANNTNMVFEGYGTHDLYINGSKITLEKVLYSKDATKNLISGYLFADLGITATIRRLAKHNIRLELFDQQNKPIGHYYSNSSRQFKIIAENRKINYLNNNVLAIEKLDKYSEKLWH